MEGRTVLIVDDHASFRLSARQLLAAEGFDVVGEAGDASSAIRAANELHPDIVLLDVQLPDGDGFGVADVLAGQPEQPRVVLTSTRLAREYGARLERGSVCGFIHKPQLSGDAIDELVDDCPHAGRAG